MLNINLVFIEQNCTFYVEVSRVCVSVSSGHLPTYMVCADPESDTTLTTEVGQCMPCTQQTQRKYNVV